MSFSDPAKDPANLPEKKKFEANPDVSYIEFGDNPKALQLVTTYPQGAGLAIND